MNAKGGCLALMLLASGAVVLSASPAQAACAPVPPNALEMLASKKPVAGKAVGSGYDVVAVGTITKISHARPNYRYRFTMAVDSVVGGQLPGTYTFFASSRSAYPFAVGQAYAVPLARRKGTGPPATTELWSKNCDPITEVDDLAAARAIIERTKPGAKPSAATAALAAAKASAAAPKPTAAAAIRPRVTFEDDSVTYERAKVFATLLMIIGILVAVAAAIESRMMHRQLL